MSDAVFITGSQFVLAGLVLVIQTNVDVRRLVMAGKVIQFPGTKVKPPVMATETEVRSISVSGYFEVMRTNGLFFKNSVNEADFAPPAPMMA